jgi:hypothetical protein
MDLLRCLAKFLQFRVLILSGAVFFEAFCSAVGQQFIELPSNKETGVSIDRFIGSWKYSEAFGLLALQAQGFPKSLVAYEDYAARNAMLQP